MVSLREPLSIHAARKLQLKGSNNNYDFESALADTTAKPTRRCGIQRSIVKDHGRNAKKRGTKLLAKHKLLDRMQLMVVWPLLPLEHCAVQYNAFKCERNQNMNSADTPIKPRNAQGIYTRGPEMTVLSI
jgi:hypothetical protein